MSSIGIVLAPVIATIFDISKGYYSCLVNDNNIIPYLWNDDSPLPTGNDGSSATDSTAITWDTPIYLSKTPLQDVTCEIATQLIIESAAYCFDSGFPGVAVHKVSNPAPGVMSIYCAELDALIESTKQVIDRSTCQSNLSSDCSFAIGDEQNTWAVYDSCLLLLDSQTGTELPQSTADEDETTEEGKDDQTTSITDQSTSEEDAASVFLGSCSLQEPWNVVVGYVTTDLYTPPLIDASLALSVGSTLGENSRFQYVPNIESLSIDIPIEEYLKAYVGVPSDENTLNGVQLEDLQRRSSVWMEETVDVNHREAEIVGVDVSFLQRMTP